MDQPTVSPSAHYDQQRLKTKLGWIFAYRIQIAQWRGLSVSEELISFTENESEKGHVRERLLGSSEVIESIFGKLKYLEKDQSKSGFTALLLSLSASVSETSLDIVQKSMESVPTKKVSQWFKENIG